MKVTQEKLPQSQIQLTIEVPADATQKTYDQQVKAFLTNVNLPGFRKGKVPQKVLLQRIGESRIKAAALEQIFSETTTTAIEQNSLKPISNYELVENIDELITKFTPGQDLVFSVKFDVAPEVEIGDYKAIKVKAEEVPFQQSQVDDFLAEKQREYAPLIPVEGRPAQMGDVVIIDYHSHLTGKTEVIEGGSAEDFQLELVEKRFLDDFIAGVVGMEAGTTKVVTVKFPTDYPREDLAGQSADFHISLKEIKNRDLPELDDDFAQEYSEYETMAELRQVLTQNYQEKAAEKTKENKISAIFKELVKIVKTDLPESLILEEVDRLVNRTLMQLDQMGMDVKKAVNQEIIDQMRTNARPEAIRNIQQSLALMTIAKQEKIEPTAPEIQERLAEYKEQMQGRTYDEQRLKTFVYEDLLKEKTIDWLLERVEIELLPPGSLTETEEDAIEPENESDVTS